VKLSIDRKALSDAARAASKFLPTIHHITALQHLEIEAHSNQLMVSATNLDSGRTVEVEADIELDGRVLVPQNFAQIAAKAQGDTLTLEASDSLEVSDGVSRWKLALGNIEDYPQPPDVSGDAVDIVSWSHIQAVATAAGTKNDRPILTGVHFGDGYAAATDSYRLAWTPIEAPEALIPAYAIRSLETEVSKLRISERHAAATIGDGLWWSRLIDGSFVDWQRLWKKLNPTVEATVSTEALTDAVRRAGIVAPVLTKGSDRWHTVTLEVGDGITVKSGDDFTELVEADVSGEITANFNVGYLVDALAPVDKATLRFTDEYKPLLIESDWWNALIMPIRV
jgi:DNA polymerase III sliding clamp (beta) subunit (PCNA family)